MSLGAEVDAIAARVRDHPGLRNKAPIGMVSDVFGAGDWVHGPGDDGAVVPAPGGSLVVGGEAMAPAFVERDPFGAGVAAVVTNVNDLAAMGARPLAIVDAVVASEAAARAALEGMRFAADLYDVPVVGGHLTVQPGPAFVSAFGLGRAGTVLSVANAAPGQSLLLACVTEGRMRQDFPFFPSFDERGRRLAGDVRVLADVAAAGTCVAAKDVSMAGIVGSAAMLVECRHLGVTVDLEAVPVPAGVDLATWLIAFPCFAFLLCVPPGREDDCARPFLERGIEARIIGSLDPSGVVAVASGGRSAVVVDLNAAPVTGLARQSAERSRQR
ncbi:MAG: AIR synthase related protein [Actinomycetota bacterium]|nr:AIR synthase related protein [Actinomycetota bacterium]